MSEKRFLLPSHPFYENIIRYKKLASILLKGDAFFCGYPLYPCLNICKNGIELFDSDGIIKEITDWNEAEKWFESAKSHYTLL